MSHFMGGGGKEKAPRKSLILVTFDSFLNTFYFSQKLSSKIQIWDCGFMEKTSPHERQLLIIDFLYKKNIGLGSAIF